MLVTDEQKAKLMEFIATKLFINSDRVDQDAAVLFSVTGDDFYNKVIAEYELHYGTKFE